MLPGYANLVNTQLRHKTQYFLTWARDHVAQGSLE